MAAAKVAASLLDETLKLKDQVLPKFL